MFDTEKFIKEVKRRPAIYDSKHVDYHNRDLKTLLWMEIGTAMFQNWETFPDDGKEKRARELAVKWKSIRDHFVKELKISNNENANGNVRKKKRYIYYDQLLFLLPTIDSRHFKAASENETEISVSMRERMKDDFDYEAMSFESGASNISIDNDIDLKSAKRKKHDNFSESGLTQDTSYDPVIRNAADLVEVEQNLSGGNVQLNYFPVEQNNYNRDRMGNKAFLLSLLPLLNKIPDDSVIDFRIDMMRTVQKYIQSPKFVCVKTENNFDMIVGNESDPV